MGNKNFLRQFAEDVLKELGLIRETLTEAQKPITVNIENTPAEGEPKATPLKEALEEVLDGWTETDPIINYLAKYHPGEEAVALLDNGINILDGLQIAIDTKSALAAQYSPKNDPELYYYHAGGRDQLRIVLDNLSHQAVVFGADAKAVVEMQKLIDPYKGLTAPTENK